MSFDIAVTGADLDEVLEKLQEAVAKDDECPEVVESVAASLGGEFPSDQVKSFRAYGFIDDQGHGWIQVAINR
jgi:hypothetical protein